MEIKIIKITWSDDRRILIVEIVYQKDVFILRQNYGCSNIKYIILSLHFSEVRAFCEILIAEAQYY